MIEQYLERLFTWESLENTERGVEFELKNRLIETDFEGIERIAVDGETVPSEAVTLEVDEDERYRADEVTADRPLHLDLAETVQVVLERDRLRLGVHELTVELRAAGYGEVSFTTDDEVTTADLVDVDPGEYTVAELRELAAEIREPVTFERLLEAERGGKNRKTAMELLAERHEAAEPLSDEEMVRAEPTAKDAGGSVVTELLVDVLESPQRVSVYLTVQALGSGTPAEIAARTLFPERLVASTLEDLEAEGIAERDDDGAYSVVGPVAVLQKQQRNLWNVLRSAL